MITFATITGRSMFERYVKPYAKALAGAMLAGLGAFIVAAAPDEQVTMIEWAAIAATMLGTLLGVRQIPNVPRRAPLE